MTTTTDLEGSRDIMRFAVAAAAALAVCVASFDASAQGYPQRAVKFMLPFGPGSGADITTRLLGDKLATRWGKPVVVENRAGGDGMVAINAFLAANDDHSLLYFPVGTFATHPFTQAKVTYDAERDLIPVVNVTATILAIGIPSSMKPTTLREMIELLRAEPNKHNSTAAAGNSDFLLSGLLKTENLQVAKVPYRDIMQAPADVGEGRVQFLLSSLASMQSLAQAGKIRILAVTSRKRVPSQPGVPTVAEAGYPGLTMESIQGVFGPKTITAAVREQIAADVRAVIEADPTIPERLEKTGQVIDLRGPQDFVAGIKELQSKLAEIARLVDMKPPQQ
jgi:tripartite-type tricarboxylate transporter receptor subunit TctC